MKPGQPDPLRLETSVRLGRHLQGEIVTYSLTDAGRLLRIRLRRPGEILAGRRDVLGGRYVRLLASDARLSPVDGAGRVA